MSESTRIRFLTQSLAEMRNRANGQVSKFHMFGISSDGSCSLLPDLTKFPYPSQWPDESQIIGWNIDIEEVAEIKKELNIYFYAYDTYWFILPEVEEENFDSYEICKAFLTNSLPQLEGKMKA